MEKVAIIMRWCWLLNCMALGCRAVGATYSTTFPLTENPINESNRWMNGQAVGLDWTDVLTTNHTAEGTMPGPDFVYSDSTAILTGLWGSNQTVTAVVYCTNQVSGGVYEEVELRLRSSLSPHFCAGYEVMFSLRNDSSAYCAIARWNGALNDFISINSVSGSQCIVTNGSTISASIVGNTITAVLNWVALVQGTDGTFTSGNPGMGFYLAGTTGANNDYGFSKFASWDDLEQSPTLQIALDTNGPGSVLITGSGFPHRNYSVQFNEDLKTSDWQVLGTVASDDFGVFSYTEAVLVGTKTRFYRVIGP